MASPAKAGLPAGPHVGAPQALGGRGGTVRPAALWLRAPRSSSRFGDQTLASVLESIRVRAIGPSMFWYEEPIRYWMILQSVDGSFRCFAVLAALMALPSPPALLRHRTVPGAWPPPMRLVSAWAPCSFLTFTPTADPPLAWPARRRWPRWRRWRSRTGPFARAATRCSSPARRLPRRFRWRASTAGGMRGLACRGSTRPSSSAASGRQHHGHRCTAGWCGAAVRAGGPRQGPQAVDWRRDCAWAPSRPRRSRPFMVVIFSVLSLGKGFVPSTRPLAGRTPAR